MRSIALVSALAAASAVHAGPASKKTSKRQDITPITAKGNAFFKGNERFYVRGIAYQPGGSSANLDPLADPKVCLPDIDKFKDLGLNMIRVYSTDNSKDHSECMDALAEAGIYVALDANNPDYSINRDKPEPSYNHVYLQSVFATIDEFIKYDNTFGFFSGNEVIHDEKETTLSARFVKATTRDMRQYIRARGYRKALVGYSAADVDDNRIPSAHYFNCGTEDERSDFFAFVSPPRELRLAKSSTDILCLPERLRLVLFLLHRLGLGQEGQAVHGLRHPHLLVRIRLQEECARLPRDRGAHERQDDAGLLGRAHVRVHV